MDAQFTKLVDKVWSKYLQVPPDQRLLIAIGGIPGSGKTTLARNLVHALNARHALLDQTRPIFDPISLSIAVPMDGFHLTRAQLSAMPDPAHAHARRGAEFTFDGAGFLALVRAVREPIPQTPPLTGNNDNTAASAIPSPLPTAPTIYAPSFDHAIKDPREGDIAIRPYHRVVVFEGNYVVMAQEPWATAAALMDERWFVSVDFDVARRRLVRRHVEAGIAADADEAGRRADGNDLVNGAEIVAKRGMVDEVVASREDGGWGEP